jgi:phosphoribosylamine--glycine ligase
MLAICDGKSFCLLDSSQDHKQIFDNDQGPNTGGMGAYSPALVVTEELRQAIADKIIRPVVEGMADEEAPFKGILYAGIMLTKDGPKVLEFNTRFGDPEAQAILPRLKTDLVDVMIASVEGKISEISLEWDARPCVCVVMAAGGYPGNYAMGQAISGLDQIPDGAIVFHAGTKQDGDKTLSAGGRVLGVTALGHNIAEAITNAYAAVGKISFDGVQYRKDIGKKALNR